MHRGYSVATVLTALICTVTNSWAAASADEGTFTSVFAYVFIGYCSLVALTHIIEFIRLRNGNSGKHEELATSSTESGS
ncbi:MAG: hypothetical protein GJT30_09120 [Geobacter sp.]|nr:hypothetical protein [Geobacter sp.]